MNDVIALKRSSLRPRLVEATMFLKLYKNLIPNNPPDIKESLIWNTLIPLHHELPDNVDDFDDNENEEEEEEEDDDDDDNDEDDDLSLVPVDSEESDYTCNNMKI